MWSVDRGGGSVVGSVKSLAYLVRRVVSSGERGGIGIFEWERDSVFGRVVGFVGSGERSIGCVM